MSVTHVPLICSHLLEENPENELEHEEWLAQKLMQMEAQKAAEKDAKGDDGPAEDDDDGEEV